MTFEPQHSSYDLLRHDLMFGIAVGKLKSVHARWRQTKANGSLREIARITKSPIKQAFKRPLVETDLNESWNHIAEE